jgi:hypothetical protein
MGTKPRRSPVPEPLLMTCRRLEYGIDKLISRSSFREPVAEEA